MGQHDAIRHADQAHKSNIVDPLGVRRDRLELFVRNCKANLASKIGGFRERAEDCPLGGGCPALDGRKSGAKHLLMWSRDKVPKGTHRTCTWVCGSSGVVL